jgi:hypothetical protein
MEKYTGVSSHASLATVGLWMQRHQLWEAVEAQVKIKQKVLKHTPTEKLKDLFINLLAGGHGIVEINTRLRADPALQRAFGRGRCAEQSTVSDTLNACTRGNVQELRAALQTVYRQHGRGYRHDYAQRCQILDIDLSALLAGKQAEGATKGYFSGQINRRGRQVGRVLASLYDEIVSEQLAPGTVQLEKNLPDLIQLAETVLDLDDYRRTRTILRIDAGGGTEANINFWLNRGYRGITKLKSWQRTAKLVASVTTWTPAPELPQHEYGWVTQPYAFAQTTQQLAVRWPNPKKGGWQTGVLVFTLSDAEIFEAAQRPRPTPLTDADRCAAILAAYNRRGGAAETSFKNSKQGLGLHQRNKKRFQAQEMLLFLAQLAYNLIGWVQQALAPHSPTLARFGTRRMLRDAFQILGRLDFAPTGQLIAITLNQQHKLAAAFHAYGLAQAATSQVAFYLGEI